MVKLKTKQLVSIMQQKGLTQRELAKKIKVSHASVSEWIAGVRNPKPSRVKAIAEILGVSVSDISDIQIVYNRTESEAFNKELEKLNAYWGWLSKEQRQNLMGVIKEMALVNRRKEEEEIKDL